MNILIKLALLPFCVLILISLSRAYISHINDNEIDVIRGKSLLYSLLTKFQQKVMNLGPIDRARSILTMLITQFGKVVTSYDIKIKRKFDQQVFDYIIIGSGSAGSVLANRLSENKTNRILILEAGGKEDSLQNIPILSFLLQKSKNDWIYESASLTKGAKGLNNRKIPIPRGKIVGGCSSINYMLYVRGNSKDFDEWEKLGASGWSFKNVFPYFVKSEDQKDNSTSKGYHGYGGPLTVSTLDYAYKVDSAFLKACQEIGLKLGDLNGEQQEQFMYSQFTIRDGKRCSTAKAFLAKATFRQNVRLMLFARVNRIVFNNNKQAVGVQFTYNNREYEAKAEKEIILSAGAINTPQILMLSGIGPEEHLNSLGIPVIVNSPGVGSNLQDHPYTIMAYETAKSTSFVYSRPNVLNDIKNFWKQKTGPFASSGLNVIGFHRTKHSLDSRPDIQIHELSYIPGGAFPDLALGYLLNIKRSVLAKYFLPHIFKDGVMFAVTLVRPSSRGTVRLKSNDPRQAPIVDLNLFEEEKDVLSMVEGCKLILNITSAPSFQKLKPKRLNGPLEGCEEFPLDSDEYLQCLIRTLTFTIYHAVGTAKMGFLNDSWAVVDSELRVKGVHNLRVVDASVMPTITTGNTNAPTIMIAEKASDIILGKSLKPSLPPYKDLNELLRPEQY